MCELALRANQRSHVRLHQVLRVWSDHVRLVLTAALLSHFAPPSAEEGLAE